MGNNGGDELLNKKQVAALLQVSESTVERLTKSGQGPPSVKFGRSRRWLRSDVRRWIAERRREQPEG